MRRNILLYIIRQISFIKILSEKNDNGQFKEQSKTY